MELGSNKIGILAKQRNFGVYFADFVSHCNIFGRTMIFKVKVLFVSQQIIKKCRFILLKSF